MNIQHIDVICDRYEERLKAGDRINVGAFLHQQQLPADDSLVAELHKLQREYLSDETLTEPWDATPATIQSAASAPPIASRRAGAAARYELHDEIARGGMGAVIRCRDTELGRELAIKVLLDTHKDRPEMVQRFVEEAQIGGQLQHPGIAPVHELGTLPDGRPFFSMKLVQGQTLSTLLKERADLVADRMRFLNIFEQICQTLAYAHSRGVIHRDLKPSNIMVGAFGEVQVMDWGLAKVLRKSSAAVEADRNVSHPRPSLDDTDVASKTFAGARLGTPAYMSPEQARGENEQVDERADVFGLGAILCVILTGEPPYSGQRGSVLRQAEAADLDPAYVRLDQCGADAELIRLARRCLAREARERPRHAGELAEELAAYLGSVEDRLRQAELKRVEAEAQSREERKRRRVWLALASSLLLLIVGAGSAAWWYAQNRIAEQTAKRINSDNAAAEITDLLNRSSKLRDGYDFDTSRTLLAQAEARVPILLKPQTQSDTIQQARKDVAVVEELDAIRSRKMTWKNGGFDHEFSLGNNGAYAQAFRDYGIDVTGNASVEEIGELVGVSSVREDLLAALDEWGEYDLDLQGRIFAIARIADSDPVRSRIRNPATWNSREALLHLVRNSDSRSLSAATILIVSRQLARHRETTAQAKLFADAAVHYPEDFWLLFECARAHAVAKNHEEAIGYYRAALALRANNAAVLNNLGSNLEALNRLDEAEAAFRKAIEVDPSHAIAHCNLGIALGKTNRLADAEAAYRKAIELDPKYAPAYYNLGLLLKQAGRLEEAETAYRKAIELDRKNALAYRSLGRLLRVANRLEEAEAAYRTAIVLDPKFVAAYTDLGNLLHDANRLEEAELAFRNAIVLDPKEALAYYNLGHVLKKTNRLDEAEAAYRKAVELDPKFAPAYYDLGILLYVANRLEEAEAAYRKAIELDPKYAPAYVNLGNLLHDANRLEEAEAVYRKAIELDPKFVAAYINLGSLLNDTNRLEEAEAAYRKAIELDPKCAPAYYNLGLLLHQANRLAEAEAAYRKAIELDPKLAEAYVNLGNLLRDANRLEEAEAAYRKAIVLDPKLAEAYYNLGILLHDANRLEEAEAAFRKAIEFDPENAPSYYKLGSLLHDTNRLAEAEAAYRKAIELDPKFVAAYYGLGCVLGQARRIEEAEAAYRRALEIDPNFPEANCNLGLRLLQHTNQFSQALELIQRGHDLGTKRGNWANPSARWIAMAKNLVDLDRKLEALEQGGAEPETADARLALASFALSRKNRPAVAARLFRGGISSETIDRETHLVTTYRAACGAALLAAGAVEGAPKLSEEEQASWRALALHWLQKNLAGWQASLSSTDTMTREVAIAKLAAWLEDPAFATVRGSAIETLPAGEQAAWREFWDAVEQVATEDQASNDSP